MLRVVEREPAAPGLNEVRVRIVRSGVNPTDWKSRQGPMSFAEVVPNHDGTGVIDALGPGVNDLAVGDRAAIQLAVWAGAGVIATVSSEAKAALARAAGADHTIDYVRGDVAEHVRTLTPQGIDIVVEVAPATNLATDLAVVKSRGTIAIYANDGGDQPTTPIVGTRSTVASTPRC